MLDSCVRLDSKLIFTFTTNAKIVFDLGQTLTQAMAFTQRLAHAGKVTQGLFVAGNNLHTAVVQPGFQGYACQGATPSFVPKSANADFVHVTLGAS